jgi:hypothetical protein
MDPIAAADHQLSVNRLRSARAPYNPRPNPPKCVFDALRIAHVVQPCPSFDPRGAPVPSFVRGCRTRASDAPDVHDQPNRMGAVNKWRHARLLLVCMSRA